MRHRATHKSSRGSVDVELVTGYWPWWIGALALGGVTIGFTLLIGRPLGVSGSWSKVIGWREERKLAKNAAAIQPGSEAAHDAFLAATLAEFGEMGLADVDDAGDTNTKAPAGAAKAQTIPWTAHLVFLFCMFLGGFLATYLAGNFQLHFELSALHTRFAGGQWQSWAALLFGGMMVGFGTQMAGGCTSGHGLSGCSRLATASLIATMSFFGTAVAVSFFVEVLAR
ncbi:MAG: YeeE/YedE thiosulfate transporter family protein [Gammaproteobacteria bacterium]